MLFAEFARRIGWTARMYLTIAFDTPLADSTVIPYLILYTVTRIASSLVVRTAIPISARGILSACVLLARIHTSHRMRPAATASQRGVTGIQSDDVKQLYGATASLLI